MTQPRAVVRGCHPVDVAVQLDGLSLEPQGVRLQVLPALGHGVQEPDTAQEARPLLLPARLAQVRPPGYRRLVSPVRLIMLSLSAGGVGLRGMLFLGSTNQGLFLVNV